MEAYLYKLIVVMKGTAILFAMGTLTATLILISSIQGRSWILGSERNEAMAREPAD